MLQPISSCLIINTLPKQVKTVYYTKGSQGPYREWVKSSELEQIMKYIAF